MRRYLLLLLVFFSLYPVLASAKTDCDEVSRFYSYPTSTTVNTDVSKPKPGQEITVSAQVATSGRLGVACLNPDWKRRTIGGTINLYANGVSIGSMEISISNTPVPYNFDSTDIYCVGQGIPEPNCTFHYQLNNKSNYSVKYTIPKSISSVVFSASFSGDKFFSEGSSSESLIVKPVADISPINTYLLQD